jgi:N-acetylornithine carbamoyltransferase
MKNFNDLAEFSVNEIEQLISLSDYLEKNPQPRVLEGKVMAMLFLSPSLRTLSSFQSAMSRLGGATFVISPEMSIYGLESRSGIIMDGAAAEHINEAVPVIASYGDVIGIRAFGQRESLEEDLDDRQFKQLVKLVNTPCINMESARHHPCQSLGDWKTMSDLGVPGRQGKVVISWTNHPQPLPYAIPASTLEFCAMRGMDVTVLSPEGFELPSPIMEGARKLAMQNGGTVQESNCRLAAMESAHVLYASSWSSAQHYGDAAQEDRLKRTLNFADWVVDESWFDNAQPECRFMHNLPIRRGVTCQDEILDGPRSEVIREAKNRMLVQMAVLHEILAAKN